MYLSEGAKLANGRYVILSPISHGGFGRTYIGYDNSLKARVAIKEFFVSDYCGRDAETGKVVVLSTGQKGTIEKLRKRFAAEASAVFKMNHPNIVRVSNIFEENDTAYFVMEYIDGMSLQDIVAQHGALPENIAVGYIRQICKALQYVHARNRLHLDVKPANIMVDKTGRAVLIDFGASKHYDKETHEETSTLLGINTAGYAPAEQLSRTFTTFGASTDIYALGATLYKLVTGITPPDSITRITGVQDITIPPTVSTNVRNAILASMNHHRNDRPQSIAEFLKILEGRHAPAPQGPVPSDPGRTTIDHNHTPTPQSPVQTPPDPESNKSNLWMWILLAVLAIGCIIAGIFVFSNNTTVTEEGEDTPIIVQPGVVQPPIEETNEGADTEPQVKETDGTELKATTSNAGLVYGKRYVEHGSISNYEGDYPVTFYLTFNENGTVTGKYCYDNIISKYGDKPQSYFRLSGTYDDNHISLRSYEYGKSPVFENIELSYDGGSNSIGLEGVLTNANTGTNFRVDAGSAR